MVVAVRMRAMVLTGYGGLDKLEHVIRDAVGGAIDVALDVVGGSAFMPLVNALRQGGRYSSSGSIAGPLVEFDLRQLVHKDLQLTGATIRTAGYDAPTG